MNKFTMKNKKCAFFFFFCNTMHRRIKMPIKMPQKKVFVWTERKSVIRWPKHRWGYNITPASTLTIKSATLKLSRFEHSGPRLFYLRFGLGQPIIRLFAILLPILRIEILKDFCFAFTELVWLGKYIFLSCHSFSLTGI